MKKTKFIPSFFLIIFLSVAVSGCLFTDKQASLQPDPMPELDLMKKEITTSHEKISQLEQQISILQITVNKNLKKIHDLTYIHKPHYKSEKKSIQIPKQNPIKQNLSQNQIQPKDDFTFDIYASPISTNSTKEITSPVEKNSSTISVKDIYNNAIVAYKNDKFAVAAVMFKSIVLSFPDNALANNAAYWEGECYYSQKKFILAIEKFKALISNYPNEQKVPDAMLKIAYSYNSLDDIKNTKKFLRKTVKNFPFSPSGIKAEAMLNIMQ